MIKLFKKFINVSYITVFLISLSVLLLNLNAKRWEKHLIIDSDPKQYYAYLPAVFIEHDFTMKFWDTDVGWYSRNYWPLRIENGNLILKTSIGLAYLYAPFFFMADFYTRNFTYYNADGFTRPYHFFILLSAIFYFIIGLIYLRKILLRFFNHIIVSLTLIVVVFGTNLFYYIFYQPSFSHSYNFAVIIVFIYLSINWHEKITFWRSLLIGLFAGLIILIRPNNIIFVLFFVFYNVNSFISLRQNIIMFLKNYYHIIIILICVILIWLPQVLYWKYLTGDFFYYSYRTEKFFFANPHIIEGIFSFRKGWLVYTPVMIFALLGIFFMFIRKVKFSFALLLITISFIYVALSWWCWWYGGSFGMRAFIDMYGLLAIPLAFTINYFYSLKYRIIKILFFKILIFFTFLNIFQSWQTNFGCMSTDSNTFEYYKCVFLKTKDCYKCNSYLKSPNYENAGKYGKE